MDAPTILLVILSLLRPPTEAARLAEAGRLAPLADAIAAAGDADVELPWRGPSARDAAKLALVAVAWHESGFKEPIIRCQIRGALGDATAFQLLGKFARGGHSVDELCASMPLAAERALAVLSVAGRTCSNAGGVAAFQGYASGRCGRAAPVYARLPDGTRKLLDADAGLTRCSTWERLTARAGIAGATCWRRPFPTPLIESN